MTAVGPAPLAGRARSVFLAALLAVPSLVLCVALPARGGDLAAADTLHARAGHALDAGDANAAEALFLEVLERSKNDHRAQHGLAVVALIRGDYEEVIKRARKAVKGDKRNSGYHLTLAYGYGMKAQRGGLQAMFYGGKFKGECELAIKYDPRNVDAHFALLQYYVFAPGIAGGGADKAEEAAATISELDAFRGFMARAFIARQRGDLATAETAYVAAAALDTSSVDGWVALTSFYLEQERYGEAIPAGERVLRLEPDNHGVLYQLARAHLLLGDDLDAALRGFTEYLDAGIDDPGLPDPASAHWRLGMVHAKAGRNDLAKASWEAALALVPEHEQATACLDTLRREHPELR